MTMEIETREYKLASRANHPEDTVVTVGGSVKIGGGSFQLIAGPCSIESIGQITEIANGVKAEGATILRGGAFKPRTSPYTFQGLREDGIQLLVQAKEATGMPIVTEVMDVTHIDQFENVDMFQVGARSMQNYELLKALGKQKKPVLLKRGMSATLEEILLSAEYILKGGNSQVILCERGIRTFETSTRFTLDLTAIPLLKQMTHLPVIVDPSHATGRADLVIPMSLAAVAAGADGLMIEVHNDPNNALSDGRQSINFNEFAELTQRIAKLRTAL